MAGLHFAIIPLTFIIFNPSALRAVSNNPIVYTFTKVSPPDTVPQGHAMHAWSDISSEVQCARMTVRECNPKGFLYDAEARLCTPLFWVVEAGAQIQSNGNGKASLYRIDPVCRDGFQIFEYDTNKEPTCIKLSTGRKGYKVATKSCKTYGGHLISVKTEEKLNSVASLAQDLQFWVGLDSLSPARLHIWQEDGEVLTKKQKEELFKPGEGENVDSQPCVARNSPESNKLGDIACTFKKFYFCETKLLGC